MYPLAFGARTVTVTANCNLPHDVASSNWSNMSGIKGAAPAPEITSSMSATESLKAALGSNFESVLGNCLAAHHNTNSGGWKNSARGGERASSVDVDFVRNPVDGSIMMDHHGVPISIDRLLATKPLKQDLLTRPGPGNKKLTYMSGEVVTRTLNLIFGYDGWNLNIQNTQREECVQDEKGRWRVVYTALVRVTHLKSGAYREDCGMGDSLDKNMGIAISHAQKSSITDAMKRAARHFGEKLGNSLYHGDFTINRAPVSLQQALDQLDAERIKLLGTVPITKPRATNLPKEECPLSSKSDDLNAKAVNQGGVPLLSSNSSLPDQHLLTTSAAHTSRPEPCPLPQGSNIGQTVISPPSMTSTVNNRVTASTGTAAISKVAPNLSRQDSNSAISTSPQPFLSAPLQQNAQTSYANVSAVSLARLSSASTADAVGNRHLHQTISSLPHSANANHTHGSIESSLEAKVASNNVSTPCNAALASFNNIHPPPTSTQGLQSSNLFGNKRDSTTEMARPSTSVGRKSDPLPQPSAKGSLLCDSIQQKRVPLSSIHGNVVDECRKKAKINPYS